MRGDIGRAIDSVLSSGAAAPMTVKDVHRACESLLGREIKGSTVRSYLNLHTPSKYRRVGRGLYVSDDCMGRIAHERVGSSCVYHCDCVDWLSVAPRESIHGVVTDPPYGVLEYTDAEKTKLRAGRGRVAAAAEIRRMHAKPRPEVHGSDAIAEGGSVPVLPRVRHAAAAGARPRGPCDRRLEPAAVAHSVALSRRCRPREARRGRSARPDASRRRPPEERRGGVPGRDRDAALPIRALACVQKAVRRNRSREPSAMGDRSPAQGRRRPSFRRRHKIVSDEREEKALAPHPSLKPQSFMRQVVKAVLPLGSGVVLDPFCGSGSTLAAANRVGYRSIGIERDAEYYGMALSSIGSLSEI